ncbi:TonB-dependent receptor [Sulfuriferula nivalis]|uniref:TonB-dependent receptor n=2 Tax=Sulfuriferula nivalis TaxID=2675298 RepID=A0A809S966_9PROT|nr:TonB-dependent receptor [Sulfuriferula nivalis]
MGACLNKWYSATLLLAVLVSLSGSSLAGGIQTLDTVDVVGVTDDLVGVADSASQGTVVADQIDGRPLLRPGELLETIPGLIVTQHSGSGKANQYFLRGFNLDHGTDFSVFVDDMPVNFPTHAHGQGYADANFLIPELVDSIQYRKGPYSVEDGDFSAAGSARVKLRDTLSSSFVDMGVGGNGYRRMLTAGSPTLASGHLLYALEVSQYDGPWDVPENGKKYNGLLRYTQGTDNDGWSLTGMAYSNDFTATDQVAQRAIDSGLIDRYGSLNPSDGGHTHRYSLSGRWANTGAGSNTHANFYVIDYRLDLFSDFTYYMNDPVHGDQFEQLDDRTVIGGATSHSWLSRFAGYDVEHTIGSGLRFDDIRALGLFNTEQRQRLSTVSLDSVQQASVNLYYQEAVQWNSWLRSIAGVRADQYSFDVASDTAVNSGRASAGILSPKLSLVFGPWDNTEYYLNIGRGFHSNDGRGATLTVDPSTGLPAQKVNPLVPAMGYEVGVRSVPMRGLQTSLALFVLDIDSELVFAGDAGSTEPSRPSRRIGLEWANFYKPNDQLTLDADVSLSHSRFRVSDPVGDYIPGSIEQAASIGAKLEQGRWFGSLRLRYFGPRPLIEDNSVRSSASTIVNLASGVKLDKHMQVNFEVLNLFNAQVSDINYYYASQLAGEAAPVNDIHTHPAEPLTVRVGLRVKF